MAKKKNLYESKNAETCPCGCCRWNSSRVLKAIVGVMFVFMIAALAAAIIYPSSAYFPSSVFSFLGVVLLVVFIGWIFGFFCSCRGFHWSRHGYNIMDNSRVIAKERYAKGEITKSQYEKLLKDLE